MSTPVKLVDIEHGDLEVLGYLVRMYWHRAICLSVMAGGDPIVQTLRITQINDLFTSMTVPVSTLTHAMKGAPKDQSTTLVFMEELFENLKWVIEQEPTVENLPQLGNDDQTGCLYNTYVTPLLPSIPRLRQAWVAASSTTKEELMGQQTPTPTVAPQVKN